MSPDGSEGQTACAAYLMGVMHGLQLATYETKRGRPYCIPESITSPQAIEMFNKAATRYPDLLHQAAGTFWAATLALAFPCAPKSN